MTLSTETAPVFNRLGFATLYRTEMRRFFKFWHFAIAAPTITTLLFFAVFSLAIGDARPDALGVPFLQFLAPGLVAMTVLNTAFELTAWPVIDSRITGTFDDLVSAPLRPVELAGALVLAAVSGALVNGTVVLVAMQPFVAMPMAGLAMATAFAIGGAVLLAALGMISAMWAEKYDHVATLFNFIVMPAVFLSGVFAPLAAFAAPWSGLVAWSPFHWAIDGMRRGLIGTGETAPATAAILLALAAVTAFVVLHRLVAIGWRIRK